MGQLWQPSGELELEYLESRDRTVGPLLTAAVGAWESTGDVYSNLSRNGALVSGLVTVGACPE